MTQYSHTYTSAGVHTIRFGGTATGYNSTSGSSGSYAAIGFSTSNYSGNTPTKIESIYGSLGAIFPTLNDGSNDLSKQPRFSGTFSGCFRLTSLPSDLFNGISGAANYMFGSTFSGCTGLTSLPSDLFNGISGAAGSMFSSTFKGCTNLTTVPYDLFSGASGTAVAYMFYQTFYNDSKLNTFVLADETTVNYIPREFFGSISGGSKVMADIFFGNTAIASSCPEGTTQNVTGYESYWNSRISCRYPYTLTLYQNDSSEDTTVNATTYVGLNKSMPEYSTSVTPLTTPTREDYEFDGYYDARSGGTKYYNADMTPATTWTSDSGGALYAHWMGNNIPTTKTINWYTDSENYTSSMCTVGENIVLPSPPPTRTGFIFNGWKLAPVAQ
jgi:hypothetical protein